MNTEKVESVYGSRGRRGRRGGVYGLGGDDGLPRGDFERHLALLFLHIGSEFIGFRVRVFWFRVRV
jgi:hypothetical protein